MGADTSDPDKKIIYHVLESIFKSLESSHVMVGDHSMRLEDVEARLNNLEGDKEHD